MQKTAKTSLLFALLICAWFHEVQHLGWVLIPDAARSVLVVSDGAFEQLLADKDGGRVVTPETTTTTTTTAASLPAPPMFGNYNDRFNMTERFLRRCENWYFRHFRPNNANENDAEWRLNATAWCSTNRSFSHGQHNGQWHHRFPGSQH